MFDVALYCTWYVRTSFVNHTKLKTLILKLNNGVPCCELATYLHARQQQACTLLYTCVTWFFFLFWVRSCLLLYVRASCVSHDPVSYTISAYHTWYRTVSSGDNNFVLTNLHSVYKKMQHHQQACTLLYACVTWFFFFWGGLRSCPLLYVRASCDSRDPVSYTISAYLASYCLLRRQQLRFNQPTLDVYKKMQHHQQACTLLYTCVANFFSLWLGFCPSLYVRTWYVSLEYMKTWIFELISDVALYCTCVSRVCRIPKW